MNIGIDIDDVLVDTSSEMIKCIYKYDMDGSYINRLGEILQGDKNEDTIKFVSKYGLEVITNAKIRENASRVINELAKNNDIIFVTARGQINAAEQQRITYELLAKNEIKYKEVKFESLDKAKVCRENDINILVDDSIKHCNEAKEAGVRTILFTTKINKNIKTDIQRVNNWNELEIKLKEFINEME